MSRKTLLIRVVIVLLGGLALAEGLSMARAPVPPPSTNATAR
jgi:hypothetical protein